MTLFCEEGMTFVETQNALSILKIINKPAATSKPQMQTRKASKHYPNCGWNNHNVKTCKVKKKEEPLVAVIKATTQT